MQKVHSLFLLFFLLLTPLFSDINLTKAQKQGTRYYQNFLMMLDNSIKCKKNCKHSEREQIKKNSIRLITSFKMSQDNPLRLSLNLHGHIHLPKLSNKLELTFSKQTLDPLTKNQIDQENENIITDEKMRIGLRYYFSKHKTFNFYTKLGLKIHSPFDLYQQLTIHHNLTPFKKIEPSLKLSLYYYLTHQYFAKAVNLIFKRALLEEFIIEQSNYLYTNEDNRHKTTLEHYLKLHHFYNHKNQFSYWITYATIKDHTHSFQKDWQGIGLRHIHFLEKWLYIDIIPRLLQKRENHFKTEVALTLSLGITLGEM